MVYAEYRNNVDEYKRFCAFHLLYARGIRIYVFPAFFCLLAILFVVMAAVTGNAVLYVMAAILLIVAVALPFLSVWIQNGKINKRMRLDDSYEKVTQSFIFSFSVRTSSVSVSFTLYHGASPSPLNIWIRPPVWSSSSRCQYFSNFSRIVP